MSEEYRLPRGTQDFLPENSEKTAFVEYMLKSVSTLYAYREIRTPIFEHTNLFLRSVGESSDIVNKEMYTFLDKGERSITLRPEGTAGVIRAFVENKMFANPDLPIKLFYYGPIFRYERPGAGRYRQINQFGFECLGIKSPLIDAELIMMISSMLYMLGIKDFTVKLNSIGDKESREKYKKALRDYFEPHLSELCEDCKRRFSQNPLRILDCKVDGESKIIKNAPRIDQYLNETSTDYFNKLQQQLQKFGIPFAIEPSLVRGLDYYSDTVFEIQALTKDGKDFGALGGGGRYDGLVEEIGGPATPGIGMGFGVDRLVLLMEANGLFTGLASQFDAYIMPMNAKCNEYAFEILMYLRSNGFKVEMDYQNRSVKSQFKTIERLNIPFAIIIGEDELKTNSVSIKNTTTHEQVSIPVNQVASYIDQALSAIEQQNHSCGCGGEHHHDETCKCQHDGEDGQCECHNDDNNEGNPHQCKCGHKHE